MKIFLTKAYTYILVPLMAFFAPISGLFHLMLFLVFADLITAIIRDWKLKNAKTTRQKIRRVESKKLRRTVVKLFLYLLFIAATYSIPMICFNSGLYLAETMTAFLAIVEVKSLAENMDYINGTDIFTSLFKRFRDILSNKIGDKIDKPGEPK